MTINAHPDPDALMDLAYGELSPEDTLRMEQHVNGCADCAGALKSIGGVRRAMAPLAEVQAPDTGLESLLAYAGQAAARNAAETRSRPAWWRRLGFAGWTAVASALCVAALVSTIGMGTEARSLSGETTLAKASAPAGAERPRLESFGDEREASSEAWEEHRPREEAPAASSGGMEEKRARGRLDAAPPPPPAAPSALGKGSAGPRAQPSRKSVAPGKRSVGVAASAGAPADEVQAPMEAEDRLAEAVASPAPVAESAPRPATPTANASREELGTAAGGFGSLGGSAIAARREREAPSDSSADLAKAPSMPMGRAGPEGRAAASKPKAPAAPAPLAAAEPAASGNQAASAGMKAEVRATDREALAKEAAVLRDGLSKGASGQARAALLARLCAVEDALGVASRADATCGTLLREFPGDPGADFASRRQQARSAGDRAGSANP